MSANIPLKAFFLALSSFLHHQQQQQQEKAK